MGGARRRSRAKGRKTPQAGPVKAAGAEAPAQPPPPPDDALPEQWADYVVRRLEHLIREGRDPDSGGMSFRKWQDLARQEVAVAVRDARNVRTRHDKVTRRLLFTTAAALSTIGFWGTAWSLGEADKLVAGILCLVAGIALFLVASEHGIRGAFSRRRARKRAQRFARVDSLDKRIKRMERHLEKREKETRERLEENI